MTVNHGVPGSSPGEGAKGRSRGLFLCSFRLTLILSITGFQINKWNLFFLASMFCVYIIFSEKLDKFYIGTTDDFDKRLKQHNSAIFVDAFTAKGIPWTKFIVIDNLSSNTAYLIEKHIKSMKSKKHILNLPKYPDIIIQLIEKYS